MDMRDESLWKNACLIGHNWVTSSDTVAVENPANLSEIGRAPLLNQEQIEQSLDAATAAFSSWRRQTPSERSRVLMAWYQELQSHQEDVAHIITLEQGKALAEAKAEVNYAASYLKWFAEQILRPHGDLSHGLKSDQRIMTFQQPVGVSALITPWNFPIAMLARKVAAGIAAGCTVVAKPSELTPFTALAFVELGKRAGVPEGVVNCITADAELAGKEFCKSELVKKISFTGSTRVGKLLMEQSADRLHRLSLELGGNAPAIVFDDAKLDGAIKGIIAAKFRNNGQTCISINRLYVQHSIYENVIERLAEEVKSFRVGNGLDEQTDLGPLVNKPTLEKFLRHKQDAIDGGAKIVVEATMPSNAQGYFVSPTLLREAEHGMLFCREETFGPLLAVIPFDTEEQVVNWANDTDSGLVSYLFTQDLTRALRVSEALESGMVGLNQTAISNAAAPFGGVKQSGFGREGGELGLHEFQQTKYTLMQF